MKGDKAAAASRPFSDFGDRQPSHFEVRTPIASSYLGNEGRQMKAGVAKSRPEWRSCRETNEGRQMKARAAKSRPEWRSQRGTNEGRLGGSGRDFGDQQPNL